MKMREAPWSAARRGGPPSIPNDKAVAFRRLTHTALQGACGTTIFMAAKNLRSCLILKLPRFFAQFTLSEANGLSMTEPKLGIPDRSAIFEFRISIFEFAGEGWECNGF
jgi:hypothetical protein